MPEKVSAAIIDFWLFGYVTLYRKTEHNEVWVLDPDKVRVTCIPGSTSVRLSYILEDDVDTTKYNPIHQGEIDITKEALFIAHKKSAFDIIGVPFFDPETGDILTDTEELNPSAVFKKAFEKAQGAYDELDT